MSPKEHPKLPTILSPNANLYTTGYREVGDYNSLLAEPC